MPPPTIDLDTHIASFLLALEQDAEAGFVRTTELHTIRNSMSRLVNFRVEDKGFYLELTIIEQALGSLSANYRSSYAFRNAFKGLVVGSLVSLLMMATFPVAPLWVYLVIPIATTLEGFLNHQRAKQREWQDNWLQLEKSFKDKKAEALISEHGLMSEAFSSFQSNTLFREHLLLPLTHLRDDVLAMSASDHLRLSAVLQLHHTVNDIALALNQNQPVSALILLDSLKPVLDKGLTSRFYGTKAFAITAMVVTILLLALSFVTGGLTAVAALSVGLVVLNVGCVGAGLACDGALYLGQKSVMRGKVNGLKRAVSQLMPFFARKDPAVFPLVDVVVPEEGAERSPTACHSKVTGC